MYYPPSPVTKPLPILTIGKPWPCIPASPHKADFFEIRIWNLKKPKKDLFSFFRKMAPEVLRGVGRGRGRHKPQTRFLYYEHKSMVIKMAVMMVVINRSFDGNYEAFWKLLIHWGWNYHWPVWWYDWWWLILDGEGVEQAFQGWGERWRSPRISAKEEKHPLWWVSMGPM